MRASSRNERATREGLDDHLGERGSQHKSRNVASKGRTRTREIKQKDADFSAAANILHIQRWYRVTGKVYISLH